MTNKDYFTDAERIIVKKFYENISKINNDVIELRWSSGSIFAKYEIDYGDEDDETNEFSQYFVFLCVSKQGDIPISTKINVGELFEFNYKSFPESIWLNGEKIN